MKRKTKSQKCIAPFDIVFWTVAGYVAYTAFLYWQRRPACEYVAKLCKQVNS